MSELRAKLINKVESFLALEENWDSYGADPIREENVANAIKYLKDIPKKMLKDCCPVPGNCGNVVLEYPDYEIDFDELKDITLESFRKGAKDD